MNDITAWIDAATKISAIPCLLIAHLLLLALGIARISNILTGWRNEWRRKG